MHQTMTKFYRYTSRWLIHWMPGFLHAVLVMQYFQCSPGSHNYYFFAVGKIGTQTNMQILPVCVQVGKACRVFLYLHRWEKCAGFAYTCTGRKSVQVLPIPVQVGKVQVLPIPVQVGKVCRFCLYLFRWKRCADTPVPYAGIWLNGSKCKQDVWNRNSEAIICCFHSNDTHNL